VSLERLRGHSSIVQPARLVLALDAPDPAQEDIRRLSVIKSNLGKFPAPLGLTIGDAGLSFCAAPEPPKVMTVLDQAVEALRALLEDEPVPADKIFDELKGMGISRST